MPEQQTLSISIIHFNHLIVAYEDEQKKRSYVLLDAQLKKVQEFWPTKDGDKEIPADLGAAMKLAKVRTLSVELQDRIAEIELLTEAGS